MDIYPTEDMPRVFRASDVQPISDPKEAERVMDIVIKDELLKVKGGKQQAARMLAPLKREFVMENPKLREHTRIGQSLAVKPNDKETSALIVHIDKLPMGECFGGQTFRNLFANVLGMSADPATFGCVQQAGHINHINRPLNDRCIEKPTPYSIYVECAGEEGHQYIDHWNKELAWSRFSERGEEISGGIDRARMELARLARIMVTNPDFNWDAQSLGQLNNLPSQLFGNVDIALAASDYTDFSRWVGKEGMQLPSLETVIEQSIADGIEKLFEMGYLNPSEVQEGMRKMFPTLNLSVERRYEHLVSRAVANAINNMPMNEIIKNILRALLPVNALRKLN